MTTEGKRQISLENRTNKEPNRQPNKKEQPQKEDFTANPRDAAVTALNEIIYAENMRLLQISPIPRHLVFDIAIDTMQSQIMQAEKSAEEDEVPICLADVLLEALLRCLRGASRDLADHLAEIATQQVANAETTPMQEFSR